MPHSALRPRALSIALALALFATACGEGEEVRPTAGVFELSEVGFDIPSAVIHDPVADVYLVANVAGEPLERNGQGFISVVSPEGEVLNLRWVQGSTFGLQLNAPYGMTIHGDSLFVADLDCIRIFHRVTGESEGVRCLDAATSITGMAMGPEGSLFVTDSGMEEGPGGEPVPSGQDGIFRLIPDDDQRGATLARSPDLGHPSGIAVGSRGIFVVTAGTGEILRLTASGDRTTVLPASPGRSLSGVVFLQDGGFAYASASESTVFRVSAEGRREPLQDGLGRTGLIGYDAVRNRILVPVMDEDRVVFLNLGGD